MQLGSRPVEWEVDSQNVKLANSQNATVKQADSQNATMKHADSQNATVKQYCEAILGNVSIYSLYGLCAGM